MSFEKEIDLFISNNEGVESCDAFETMMCSRTLFGRSWIRWRVDTMAEVWSSSWLLCLWCFFNR